MAETPEFTEADLFAKYLQVPEDEIEWELDGDHSSAWWDLFNSWLEYPEDELALFSYAEEPASDSDVDSNMAEGGDSTE